MDTDLKNRNLLKGLILFGDIRRLIDLLETSKMDLNFHFVDGITPLIEALTQTYGLDFNPRTTIVKLFLKFGADPNMRGKREVPLFYAMGKENLLTYILLEYGADASMESVNDEPYLKNAFLIQDHDLASALLKAGANKESLYNYKEKKYDEKQIDRFFEECEKYEKVMDISRIKGAVKVEKF